MQTNEPKQKQSDSWRQHYPTYSFEHRDIAIEEYRSAAASVNSEERLFIQSVNVAVVVAAGLGSLGIGGLRHIIELFSPYLAPEVVVGALLVILMSFSATTLRHFANRQRELLFAKRKVVVLRRMLGLDYGNLQLVLPNWRIEGANQPFAIKLFPGWRTYVAYPFWILGIFSAVVFFMFGLLLLGFVWDRIGADGRPPAFAMLMVSLWWLGALAFQYRKSLYDLNERPLLTEGKLLARLLGLRLVSNFEYVLYRAKLAAHETRRLGIGTESIIPIVIFFEDREFFKHSGVSMRGLLRASLSLVNVRPRSGGSTITMQLLRTLFVEDYSKTARRKIIEIQLAPWLEIVLTKNQILDIYLSSVRFTKGIVGLPAAMKYYFGDNRRPPSKAEATVLTERLASVGGYLNIPKFDEIVSQAVCEGIIDKEDVAESIELYGELVGRQKVQIGNAQRFETLRTKWSNDP